MSLTIGFWDGLSAKSRTGGFFSFFGQKKVEKVFLAKPKKYFCPVF
jgi:hypothetical protein